MNNKRYLEIGINTNIKEIKYLQLGILSPDEILSQSVCEVDSSSLKNDAHNMGTVYDPRMGTLENGENCLTCGNTTIDCEGHFGHIVLQTPIIHAKFFKTIVNILKCVCYSCSTCLISKEEAELIGITKTRGENRIKQMIERCAKESICRKCNDPTVNIIVKDEKIKIYYTRVKDAIELSTQSIYNVLLKITNDDFSLLGFNNYLTKDACLTNENSLVDGNTTHRHQNRPEWMIFTVLPVLPPSARPYSYRDGEKHDDDLTDKYISIVKLNIKLANDKESRENTMFKKSVLNESEKNKIMNEMYEHINTIIDNEKKKSTLSGGRAHKGIKERISQKDGLIRKNIMGKRVNYSARSVIGGEVSLALDELGVPEAIAERLTKKEFVTVLNIEKIQTLIKQKKVNYVHRDNKKFLISVLNNFNVKIGDEVERQLIDGDWVLFNRQPTLRIESMMGFKIRILPGKTFRFNLSATTPFNADFDGDEMNIHVPQSYGADAELSSFMSVTSHIISAQHNAPVIGIVQDGLLGSYILTNGKENVSNRTFGDCMLKIRDPPDLNEFIQRAQKYYPLCFENGRMKEELDGRILFSTLFDSDFFYHKNTDTSSERPDIIIKEGIIVPESGPLCKKVLGNKANSIIHTMCIEYSTQRTCVFISNLQFLINHWFHTRGFSVGISDCIISNHEKIKNTLQKAYIECKEKIEINGELVEKEINSILNSTTNVGMQLTNNGLNKGQDNRFVIMHKSGAKGNHINCSQITAFVGQQNVNGRRIPTSLSHNQRCLPFYNIGDVTPDARGFVNRSYMAGLNPQQTFYHAMGGREGLIDTSVKTSQSGYSQRRILKKLEDLKTHFDGTVRTSNNSIVEFLYGGDAYDAAKLYYVDGKPFFINPSNLAQRLNYSSDEKPKQLTSEFIEQVCLDININGFDTENIKYASQKVRDTLRHLMKNIKLVPSKMQFFKEEIVKYFRQSLSGGGDMVGVVASSSIGEPTTQGTLNSVDWNERVYVRDGNTAIIEPIGKFIDDLLENNRNSVMNFPQEQEYLDLKHLNYEIVSVDEHGNVSWKKIEAATRHLPGGKMIKATLKSGRTIVATRGESFLVKREGKIVPERGDNIVIGDSIPVTLNHPDGGITEDVLNDVFFDKVIKLEEVESSHPKVYDFTVEETKTFSLFNGIHCYDTFHMAGVSEKDVTLGMSRLQECLDMTKNPKTPSCLVYLKDDDMVFPKNAEERVNALSFIQSKRKEYQYTTVEHLLERNPTLVYVGSPELPALKLYKYEEYEKEWWAITDQTPVDWVIQLKFDLSQLFEFKITLDEIAQIIKADVSFAEMKCVVSPMNIGKIDVYIDFEKAFVPVMNKLDLDTGNNVQLINENNINFYYSRDVVIPKMKNIQICGITNISKIYPREIKKEWLIDTQGCNYRDVLNSESTNFQKTVCDDFWQTYEVLGIEAARQIIYQEFVKVVSNDSYINPRHLKLLVDSMTFTGTITSVRREGIDKGSVGVLAKCAFEQTMENFVSGGMFCEKEDLSSVSGSVTMGKLINGGTGFSKIEAQQCEESGVDALINSFKPLGETNQKFDSFQLIENIFQT